MRTEYERMSFTILVCLDPFKDRLAVMDGRECRREAQMLKRPDRYLLPLTIRIVHFQHVVGKMFSEGNIVEIDLVQAALRSFCNLDAQGRLSYCYKFCRHKETNNLCVSKIETNNC